MKILVWTLVALATALVLVAILSPWLWKPLIAGIFLYLVAAGVHGNTGGRGVSGTS